MIPVLHWEASEIECLCKPWTPLSKALASMAATPSRVKIEIWNEDLCGCGEATNQWAVLQRMGHWSHRSCPHHALLKKHGEKRGAWRATSPSCQCCRASETRASTNASGTQSAELPCCTTRCETASKQSKSTAPISASVAPQFPAGRFICPLGCEFGRSISLL